MKFYHKLSQNSQGIFFAILTCFLVSVLVAVVRHVSEHFHVFFIVMMRNIFGLMFFMPKICHDYKDIFRTKKLHLHIFRNVNGLIAMFIWFYVVTLLPLSEAVSITFVVPIITTLAAMFFLKEKVTKKTWIAILIGFVGVLIIIRPGFREFKIAYILALLSTAMWSISNVIIKMMTDTEKPKTIVAYMSLIMMILSIPFALPYIKPLTCDDIFWFAVLGVVSSLSHLSMSVAYSKTDLSIVQPFDFTRLIFTALIAYFAFGEIVDIWVVIGSLVILFGVIVVAPKRKRIKKQKIALVDS
jgi:drug/metabolite transporter (DMT)-like permease